MTRQRAHLVAGLCAAASVCSGAALGSDGPASTAEPLPPGTYRMELRLAAHTAIPIVGSAETATVSLALAEIRRDDDGLHQTHRVCETRFEGGLPFVRITMPARMIASLPAHDYPLDLEYGAGGWRYRADLGSEHVGYRPGQPDRLPRDAADASVIDSDGDGHPGATMQLTVAGLADGELYIVQRGRSALDGRVVERGRAEGSVEVPLFEQAVLGADPGFLMRQPDIRPAPLRSTFSLVRVPDGTACEGLETAAYDPGTANESPLIRAAARREAP